ASWRSVDGQTWGPCASGKQDTPEHFRYDPRCVTNSADCPTFMIHTTPRQGDWQVTVLNWIRRPSGWHFFGQSSADLDAQGSAIVHVPYESSTIEGKPQRVRAVLWRVGYEKSASADERVCRLRLTRNPPPWCRGRSWFADRVGHHYTPNLGCFRGRGRG
ncbi:MAG: hypothetical protein M3P18_21485, partial [Actinomycetota bacterium]|nr:hypothetical protein [Actinomycetota bacterium]